MLSQNVTFSIWKSGITHALTWRMTMKMPRVFRRTITITSTETWTVSVESNQPIDLPQTEDEQPVSGDVTQLAIAPDPIHATGKQPNEE
jgi:hypothetical protein